MIKIDKNIPIPAGHNIGLRAGKYPFATMEVGDSFFIADEPRRVWTAAYGWGKRHGAKFSMHACTEDAEDGARIWRIA